MARRFGIGESAVSNWLARGNIPPSYHLQVLIEMRRRGFEIDPIVFGLEDDDADFLRRQLKAMHHPHAAGANVSRG